MTAPTTPAEVAAAYFTHWKARDFAAFRKLLADDVTFTGPLGRASDAEECVQGIEGLSRIVTDITVEKIVSNDEDAISWFLLHTTVTDTPVPVANRSHVEDGLITRIQVTFDPRPLVTG